MIKKYFDGKKFRSEAPVALKEKSLEAPKVFFPYSYYEVMGIVKTLVATERIMVNLMHLPLREKFRVLDFLCGASYVLKIQVKKIEEGIYFFVKDDDINLF